MYLDFSIGSPHNEFPSYGPVSTVITQGVKLRALTACCTDRHSFQVELNSHMFYFTFFRIPGHRTREIYGLLRAIGCNVLSGKVLKLLGHELRALIRSKNVWYSACNVLKG